MSTNPKGRALIMRGESGPAGAEWPLREMSANSRKSRTLLRSCCETYSERTRVLVAWCMESQAFRSAPRSSWK
jgi:hypothetical protein